MLAIALIAVILGGCQITKENVGTLAGAGLGAWGGSQIGSGKGQIAAAVIGGLGGAWLGNQIGSQLDERDKLLAERNISRTVASTPDYRPVAWSNPNTGHRGYTEVTRTYDPNVADYEPYEFQPTRNCRVKREFTHTINVGGQQETAVGQACLQADGTWRVVQ